MSESNWEFKGKNPHTGRKYWEKKKKTKKVGKEEEKERGGKIKTSQKQQPFYDRGNYTADIVHDAMEKRDEEKEKAIREARGLPPEFEE